MSIKSNWWRMPPSFTVTPAEYHANIRGMNIIFGAVLGFVLADTNELPPLDFALVLLVSASVVVTILYLAMSEYKLFYGATAIVAIAALPVVLTDFAGIPAIPQLQPTLAVWALMVVIVELMPQTTPDESKETKS